MSLDRSCPKELTPASLARLAVVIPCYNAAPWLERTISSVLAQIRPDTSDVKVSIIVADDGSTDDSVAVASGFGDRVQILTGPNQGACHARNAGLAEATCQGDDYIVFLDADDYYDGDTLIAATRLAVRREADMVLSQIIMEDMNGEREPRPGYAHQVAPEVFFEGWILGRFINPVAIVWRTGFVNELGGWDESLVKNQDLDISLRAMFHRPAIWVNDDGVAIYSKVNPKSITRSPSGRSLESEFRVRQALIDGARNTSFAPTIPYIHRETYRVARAAFRTGEIDLGRQVLAYLRSEGYRSHPGTLAHRVAASVLGLERKVRLWKGR